MSQNYSFEQALAYLKKAESAGQGESVYEHLIKVLMKVRLDFTFVAVCAGHMYAPAYKSQQLHFFIIVFLKIKSSYIT